MQRITVVMIPDGPKPTKQYQFPKFLLPFSLISSFICVFLAGYLFMDYLNLRRLRASYNQVLAENQGLKSEARLLMTNLEKAHRSLIKVQNYSKKLNDITNFAVKSVRKKTGIGPLTPAEFRSIHKHPEKFSHDLPLGVDLDHLVFRPVFDRIKSIGENANRNAIQLQQLLSKLGSQKSLLSSIPSISPVNGWITSGYGPRISPFTGERTLHKGIDVASPIGTPIYAPADGVVIFSGAKAGFGNFIMVAHGYGVVSRYGHNAQNMVQPGQKVKRGDQIATVGMTGRTTGPHLHYEVLVAGRATNPRKFILDLPY